MAKISGNSLRTEPPTEAGQAVNLIAMMKLEVLLCHWEALVSPQFSGIGPSCTRKHRKRNLSAVQKLTYTADIRFCQVICCWKRVEEVMDCLKQTQQR